MPRPVKIYQAWPAYVVTPHEAFEALGFKPNHPQSRTVISATSKAAAARTLSEAFGYTYAARVIEETGGVDVAALQAAGRLLEPGELYVMDSAGHHEAVVQSTGPETFAKVGRLVRNQRRTFNEPPTRTFVAEEA